MWWYRRWTGSCSTLWLHHLVLSEPILIAAIASWQRQATSMNVVKLLELPRGGNQSMLNTTKTTHSIFIGVRVQIYFDFAAGENGHNNLWTAVSPAPWALLRAQKGSVSDSIQTSRGWLMRCQKRMGFFTGYRVERKINSSYRQRDFYHWIVYTNGVGILQDQCCVHTGNIWLLQACFPVLWSWELWDGLQIFTNRRERAY